MALFSCKTLGAAVATLLVHGLMASTAYAQIIKVEPGVAVGGMCFIGPIEVAACSGPQVGGSLGFRMPHHDERWLEFGMTGGARITLDSAATLGGRLRSVQHTEFEGRFIVLRNINLDQSLLWGVVASYHAFGGLHDLPEDRGGLGVLLGERCTCVPFFSGPEWAFRATVEVQALVPVSGASHAIGGATTLRLGITRRLDLTP